MRPLLLIGLAFVSQNRAALAQKGPVRVVRFQGQYCAGPAPQGWFVVAENAQRVASGADFSSADGKATAGYSVFPAGTLAGGMPGTENPDRAVARNVSRGGAVRLSFSQRQQIGPNEFLVFYQGAQYRGAAFYQVFSMTRGGYIVVMRSANTEASAWPARGAEASAVARFVTCRFPNVPAAPDPPSLRAEADGDSLYNQWLDKEYYHNAATGENFWVSPSQDWRQNGPDGPGYYAQHGNALVKLQSGYSQ